MTTITMRSIHEIRAHHLRVCDDKLNFFSIDQDKETVNHRLIRNLICVSFDNEILCEVPMAQSNPTSVDHKSTKSTPPQP